MNRHVWPLLGFVALVVLLAAGLRLDPREVPSPLVGKEAPEFTLARIDMPDKIFSPKEMQGRVWLLNVWASWCVSCRQEHPVLVEIARQRMVPLVGLNYKEVRGDGGIDMGRITPEIERKMAYERARVWLKAHGDPYLLSVMDIDGRAAIDYGVYGVPETYLIDKAGVVRMKHIGPVSPEVYVTKILPLITALNQ